MSEERSRADALPEGPVGVSGVSVLHMTLISDARGTMSIGELDRQLPFVPQRYFTLHGIVGGACRGDHAHRTVHQFFICVHGSCRLTVDDGYVHRRLLLDSPGIGVHAPPMTWCTVETFDERAVMLCFASHYYDAADYIRDRNEFVRLLAGRGET